jgi:hypothetical protein
MKFLTSNWWLIAGLALLAVDFLASALLPRSNTLSAVSDFTQCALMFGCYLSTLPNQVAGRGRENSFWTLLAVGFSLWLLMQVLWTLYEVVLHQEVPSLFWGDTILFLHAVPMMTAFALLPHMSGARQLARDVLDAALLLVCCAYFYASYVMAWQYVVPNEAAYNFNFNIVYGAANGCLLLLAGICWLRSAGSWALLYAQFFGATLLYSGSSYVANSAMDAGHYYSGSFYDIPLAIALAWYAAIGFRAGRSRPARASEAYPASRELWGKTLALLSAGAVVAAASAELLYGTAPEAVSVYRLALTLATGVTLTALMSARMMLPHRRPAAGNVAVLARS